MKIMLSLIAFIVVAASAVLPASASNSTVPRWIHNKTAHCVWFTIDTANLLQPYRNQKAKFIDPGQTVKFDVDNAVYLKVRAEPRKTSSCASPKIGDLEITEWGSPIPPGPSETTLRGGEGSPFRIAWGH